MSEPSLPELEARRDWLYAQLSTVGDFRRGSMRAPEVGHRHGGANSPRRTLPD